MVSSDQIVSERRTARLVHVQPPLHRPDNRQSTTLPTRRQQQVPTKRSQLNTQADLLAVRLDQLVLMPDLQVRVRIDPQLVHTYAQIFREVPEEQCTCPPISVYMHNGSYVVADGFHRVTAARQANRTTLNAYVRTGTLEEAWLYGMEQNLRYGMQYTREDKQKIVTWFLDHPRYGKYSVRDIAALMGNMIPPSTVANIRNRRKAQVLQAASKLDDEAERRTSSNLDELRRQVQRAYTRMEDAAAVVIGVAHDLEGDQASLVSCVRAVRESVARLKREIDELFDVESADVEDETC